MCTKAHTPQTHMHTPSAAQLFFPPLISRFLPFFHTLALALQQGPGQPQKIIDPAF